MTSGTHSTHPLLLLLLFGSLTTSVRGTICAGLTYYLATTTSGTFTSPDYPSNYGVNVFCSWLIVANDSSHVIRLTVDTSSLENPDGNGNCTYDYGKAYDGSDLSATLLGEWCGSSTATLTSTGTSMLVVFNSDYSTVATGFSATYEAGISWATSSSSDYTVIIAVSVSTFVLITGIVVFCCIRSKKKRDRRKAGTDKERLPEAVEDGKVADDDRYSVASKSRFSQRIVPTPRGARRQPVEVAVEPQHSAVTRVIAANAAAAAAARQKELKEQEKQERKREQERKKAEEKAAKEEQRVKAAEDKRIAAEEKKKAAEEKRIAATKAAEEKKKAAEEKKKATEEKKQAAEEAEKKKAEERRKANATSGKRKKVGFQEQAAEIGASEVDGSSPTADGQTTASTATGERATRSSPKAGDTSTSPVVTAGTSGTSDSLQATKTATEATQKGGEAATLDNKNAGETTAQTHQHSGSAAARKQEKAGESSAKQMVTAAALAASGNKETQSATRDKQTAGKITVKHNEKAGLVATENNPIAGNASTTHFLISGAIVANDKQNAGETATKDTISKADKTTDKDNLKAGEIATKDKQKAEKTTKKNQKIRETAGETTSKDSPIAGVTTTESGETTSKDSTKAGVTPTESGETTSKDSTKAGVTTTGSGETTSKDSTKAGVTPTESGETTSKDNQEAVDVITKDASNAGEATGKDNPRTGASAQNGSNVAEETKASNWEVNENILQKENANLEKTKNNAEETTPADKAGETTRPKSKFVLLPTNVVLVESAETRKRKAVENQWEKLSATRHDQFTAPGGNVKPLAAVAVTSAHNKYQGDNAKVKEREGTKVKGGEDGRRTQTAASATESVEKDEGIHMDYDGGDSGKSSPNSRPTTTHTLDDTVVTPSLVTSIITDNADHQPVPIEAPCKGGDGVKATPSFSGPAQGSVADIEDRLSHALRWTRQWTYQSQKFSEPDIPSELAIKRWNTVLGQPGAQGVLTTSPRTAREAFLEVVDQATELKKIAPMTLDRHGKPVKPAARGRNHSIM